MMNKIRCEFETLDKENKRWIFELLSYLHKIPSFDLKIDNDGVLIVYDDNEQIKEIVKHLN